MLEKPEQIGKQQIKVNVRCMDGSSVMGYVNVTPEEGILGFMNDPRLSFIALHDAEMYYEAREVESFRLIRRVAVTKKAIMIVQKTAISWLEEI